MASSPERAELNKSNNLSQSLDNVDHLKSQSQSSKEPIRLNMHREYNKIRPVGRLSSTRTSSNDLNERDFHLHGRNRYMRINQPTNFSNRNKFDKDYYRMKNRFKNPILNKYEDDGDEDYERKYYVFEFADDDDGHNNNKNKNNRINDRNKINKSRRLPKLGDINDDDDDDDNNDGNNNGDNDYQKRKNKNGNQNNNNNNKKVDKEKVDKTVKMMEDLLQDPKNKNKNSKNNNDKDKNKNKINDKDKDNKNDKNNKNKNSKEDEDRDRYLNDKNIKLNKSVDDSNIDTLAKKPEKKNLNREFENNRKMRDDATQTPRDGINTTNDNNNNKNNNNPNSNDNNNKNKRRKYDDINDSADGKTYVKKLINNAQTVNEELTKKENENDPNRDRSNSLNNNPNFKNNNNKKGNNDGNSNSLGLGLEGKNGINMAILRSTDPSNKNGEQTLLVKNYQNLEEMIEKLEADHKNYDDNYIKIAKMNRLKVLMELSMKMVGLSYKDFSKNERKTMELEANRYHTTYPLPGEEDPLEVVDANGKKRVRMPLEVANDNGAAKIDVNNKYLIDPSEFITIYASKLIDHAHDTTGLEVKTKNKKRKFKI
jgi:hypothetical protein